MLTRLDRVDATDPDRIPKWFNSPVTFHNGSIDEVAEYIPAFQRRDFALTQSQVERSRLHPRLDLIVREPLGDDLDVVPIGVVSKDYALIQHRAVLDAAVGALREAGIPLAEVSAELAITEYGERMALSLYLPEEHAFDPGDGNLMALRVECLNSVDGSTRFRALIGWFRLVCGNGLVLGDTQYDVQRRHAGDIVVSDLGHIVRAGLARSRSDRRHFRAWRVAGISLQNILPWFDGSLKKTWGFKAATRAYHIATTGHDGNIVGPYKGHRPTSIPVEKGEPIPGAPTQCTSVFDLSQILAWLASRRRDVQEQIEWRQQIPQLMANVPGLTTAIALSLDDDPEDYQLAVEIARELEAERLRDEDAEG